MTHPQLIARLVDAVEALSAHVEELGCTCGSAETRNKYHAPSRRRRDSRCTGVALAVEYRGLVRRARREVKPWPYKQTLQEAIAALAEEGRAEAARGGPSGTADQGGSTPPRSTTVKGVSK